MITITSIVDIVVQFMEIKCLDSRNNLVLSVTKHMFPTDRLIMKLGYNATFFSGTTAILSFDKHVFVKLNRAKNTFVL